MHVSRYIEYRSDWNMRRPGAAHSVAWKHQKREIQLGSRSIQFSQEHLISLAWLANGDSSSNASSSNSSDTSEKEEDPRCGDLQTIGQGSKTLICISFTKLNIHLLLERVFMNFSWIFIDRYSNASKCYKAIFPGYSLTVTQMQANAIKKLHKFRNRSHFSRDAKRIYEMTYYSHASSVVSTVTPVFHKKTLSLTLYSSSVYVGAHESPIVAGLKGEILGYLHCIVALRPTT
ncbi:hypothetical protein CSKR_108117 [Clonorchis sinensis]|uniref:Uncharacterized protein n=1 Tax=Clonorchis sinensis TaxID=79923 RepID=A0A419PRR5_CLOSI|nr:hypothetical protein CSKR_108117 [Clonorchis sinensis]